MPVMRVFEGVKQLGTLGEAGVRVSFVAVPLPERYAFGLMKLADYVEETGLPMLAAKRIGMADMQEKFDQDKDPEGDPWTPLDPEYLKKKAKMKRLRTVPENILTLSFDLERAATSAAAWITTDNALFFSTRGLPGYWEVHQEGSGELMAGYAAAVRLRRDNKSPHPDDPKGGKHTNMDIGRGKATPARPFIGLSAEAIAQIIELFDLWFDEGVRSSLTIHSKTGVVQQRIGGKFGGRMFPNFGA